MKSPPNKRRRTTSSKKKAHATNSIPQADKDLTAGVLEIVSSHFLLDIKTKNINLQKLIDELKEASIDYINGMKENRDNNSEEEISAFRKGLDELLQKFKEGRRLNAMLQAGPNIQDNTWSSKKDEYVYDPHPKGHARRYDTCDEPLYPADVKPTGDEALFIALVRPDLLQEWRLLRMKNYFLGTTLQNLVNKLELDSYMTKYYGPEVDYFMRERSRLRPHLYFKTPLSSEEEAAHFDELEQNLSELTNDDLVDYIKTSNLDLREGIARLAVHAPFHWNIDDFEAGFGHVLIAEFEELSKGCSLKFLPRTRDIAFDPMLEAENYWLGVKLEGLILMLKDALLDEAIEIDNNNEDDSLADFVADEDEEDDEFLEEFYREQQEELAFAMEQRGR